MGEWWQSLTNAHRVFYIIAIASTFILFLQLVLNLVGLAGHDMDVDTPDADVPDVDVPDVDVPDDVSLEHPDLVTHDAGLGILSIRTAMAFFVGFGWGGVVMLGAGVHLALAVVIAALIGAVFLFVVFYLMKMIFSLSEEGTVDYGNAVGQTGTVYIPIPAQNKGTGQIQVVVQGRLREIPAVTDGYNDLPAGTAVKVIKIAGGSTMLVRKLEVQ